jgi:hypothetical protein
MRLRARFSRKKLIMDYSFLWLILWNESASLTCDVRVTINQASGMVLAVNGISDDR